LKRFYKIPLASECLTGYFDDESLILLNKKSGFVYGFEKESAALVMEVETKLPILGKKGVLSHYKNTPLSFLSSIIEILSCADKVEESYEAPFDYGDSDDKDKNQRLFVKAGSITFAFSKKYKSVLNLIEPVLEHLEENENIGEDQKRIDVDFIPYEQEDDKLWQLLFNKKEVAPPVSLKTLPLILQENMIILFYQSKPYLMAIHAAALSCGEFAVIMPGKSGSGKSTLAAKMAAEEFSIFSDEIALIGRNGTLKHIPFSMNIKEGSWGVLNDKYKELKSRQEYIRFDDQRVKLIAPKRISKKQHKISSIIFPKFKKGASTSLEELSPCKTLQMIKDSGYQVDSPLNENNFDLILSNILSRPSYSLIYSDIDEAINVIRELRVG